MQEELSYHNLLWCSHVNNIMMELYDKYFHLLIQHISWGDQVKIVHHDTWAFATTFHGLWKTRKSQIILTSSLFSKHQGTRLNKKVEMHKIYSRFILNRCYWWYAQSSAPTHKSHSLYDTIVNFWRYITRYLFWHSQSFSAAFIVF